MVILIRGNQSSIRKRGNTLAIYAFGRVEIDDLETANELLNDILDSLEDLVRNVQGEYQLNRDEEVTDEYREGYEIGAEDVASRVNDVIEHATWGY